MNDTHLTEAQIVQMAAEAGARAAMERVEAERQQDLRDRVDRRLRNTKLLLRNYRLFKAHVDHAVWESEEEDESPAEILEDLMMPGKNNSLIVDSIKRSATRTAVIVRHMETMMQLYQAFCSTSGAEDDLRRWRVINSLYISDQKMSVPELAAEEKVVVRTIYKDIDAACERISALMFGIDGISTNKRR